MRTVAVMAQIEDVCSRCGREFRTLGMAEVFFDGRVGPPLEIDPGRRRECSGCLDAIRAEQERMCATKRRRRAIAKGDASGLRITGDADE